MLTRCKKALALVALAIFLLPCAALAATPDYPDHFAKYTRRTSLAHPARA